MKSVLLETQGRADEAPRRTGIRVTFEGQRRARKSSCSIACWSSVGRRPNSKIPGLERTARAGRSSAASSWSTSSGAPHEPSIFAIGDVVGEPMLAHKASHEGRVAVEVMAGENVAFAPRAIPAVVFTDPELAWAGLTEAQAAKENREGHGREVSVGRVGPRDHARSHRRPDQADSRSRDRAAARRRPGRPRRRRADRRRRAGDRDGRDRDRPEAHRSTRIRRSPRR